MNNKSTTNTWVVVPNWNGQENIGSCIDSLLGQTLAINILVIDNGSLDNSRIILESYGNKIKTIYLKKNFGFSGGVNKGINYALDNNAKFIALLNNDAVAENNWINSLVSGIKDDSEIGIITSKILSSKGDMIDSTGEFLSNWCLPFPRGRHEKNIDKYDKLKVVFGASGGATLYRSSLFDSVSLFDEDFFAYYEDVDISFRTQLNGWKIAYEPSAIVYHKTGATSSKIPGFTTYQTIKNLPWLFWKNVPKKYIFTIGIRFYTAYLSFILSALLRGQIVSVLKGCFVSLVLLPKKLAERHRIQSGAKVSPEYIWSIMTHDLPPDAFNLKRLRIFYRKLMFRNK
jgi:GT2 family glycosyltransferase